MRAVSFIVLVLCCGVCSAQEFQKSAAVRDFLLKEYASLKGETYGGEPVEVFYFEGFVDLNGDGREEALVHVAGPSMCGTGGCGTYVLTARGPSYEQVSYFSIGRTPIRVLETSSHGWFDIGIWVSGGGIQPGYEAAMSFDGTKYPLNPSVPPARPLKEGVPGRIVIPDWKSYKEARVLLP
jgi:hypothetical protein